MATGDAYIIGGAEIYRQGLPLTDTLHITVVDDECDNADTYFPPIPLDNFQITDITGADTVPSIKFYTLVRKENSRAN